MKITCSGLWEFVVADSNALNFKTKIFLDFFVPFLESISNFKHFEKKDDSHSYFTSEITHCERVG